MRSPALRSGSPASGSPAHSGREAGQRPGGECLDGSGDAEVARDDDFGAIALDGADDGLGDRVRLEDDPAAETARKEIALWEARCLNGARADRVHTNATACELPPNAARESQLRVLRGRIGA